MTRFVLRWRLWLLLDGNGQTNDVMQVAEKIHAVLLAPFRLASGQGVHSLSSAGVALYPGHGMDEATLSRHTDVPCMPTRPPALNNAGCTSRHWSRRRPLQPITQRRKLPFTPRLDGDCWKHL